MASSKSTVRADSEVHITFEEQQKINKFARLNARLDELKEELSSTKNDKKNLEEAVEAVDEVELLGEVEEIAYSMGDIFLLQSPESTKDMLAEAKEKLENDIEKIKAGMESTKELMSDLRTQLYAKFGDNINLEADDD
ncbi:prefoldin subunit 4 [Neocloeon triangulifer]|uniref:prefoldin subunit 4 n=1 Tax=Neocloeon triangulifer TaxID=2078957 RepID=UPI00286F4596|nr:prefoldin subunit 4 [Neocloeon triangulifer]